MGDYSQVISASAISAREHGLRRDALPWFAQWVLPSFGTVVFAVTLIQVLFLSQGPYTLFRDSDTGWHIRNGEAILDTASIPTEDSFSYTRKGHEWFAWEWLSDVGFGFANRIAGLAGVALLAASTIAVTAWAVARLTLFLGGNLFATAAAVVVLLGTTSIHWFARPHIFSWLLALAFLGIAEQERHLRSRLLYATPVLACLWANVHGSFLLAPGILFIYAIGECVDRLTSGARVKPSAIRFAAASLASLIATFLNPYGWRLHGHVFNYLNNAYLMDHIAEFRSFSFHQPGALYAEAFLFIAVLGVPAMFRQKAYGRALLALGMIHLSLYSARHLPTAAILLLPLCVAALTREAAEWRSLRSFFEYSGHIRSIDRKVWGFVPAVAVVVAAVFGTVSIAHAGQIGFDPAIMPVRAAEFLEKHNLSDRIFSKDQWGGYLIYRFGGRTKVFIDGRSDFYGQLMLETYAQVMEVKPGWEGVLKQYDVHTVLIPADHALASALKLSPGWKQVYQDTVADVFERVGI